MTHPPHRPWLLEHLPGGRDARGVALTEPPKWAACDLVGYKPMPANKPGMKIEFESCDVHFDDTSVDPIPTWYYKSFVRALTQMDLLRNLIPAGFFRVRNVDTEEVIGAEELEGLVLRRRPRVWRTQEAMVSGKAQSAWAYAYRPSLSTRDFSPA